MINLLLMITFCLGFYSESYTNPYIERIAVATKRIRQLQINYTNLRTQIQTKRNQIKSLQSQAAQNDTDSLQNELSKLEKETESIDTQLNNLAIENESLKQILDNKTNSLAELEGARDVLLSEFETSEQELEFLKQELQNLQPQATSVDSLEVENEKLENDLLQLEITLAAEVEARKLADENYTSLFDKKQTRSSAIDSYQKNNRKLEEEIVELNDQIKETDVQNKKEQQQLENEILALQQDLTDLENEPFRIAQLQANDTSTTTHEAQDAPPPPAPQNPQISLIESLFGKNPAFSRIFETITGKRKTFNPKKEFKFDQNNIQATFEYIAMMVVDRIYKKNVLRDGIETIPTAEEYSNILSIMVKILENTKDLSFLDNSQSFIKGTYFTGIGVKRKLSTINLTLKTTFLVFLNILWNHGKAKWGDKTKLETTILHTIYGNQDQNQLKKKGLVKERIENLIKTLSSPEKKINDFTLLYPAEHKFRS